MKSVFFRTILVSRDPYLRIQGKFFQDQISKPTTLAFILNHDENHDLIPWYIANLIDHILSFSTRFLFLNRRAVMGGEPDPTDASRIGMVWLMVYTGHRVCYSVINCRAENPQRPHD